MRLATGVSSGVTCVVAREVENPSAPARIASLTACLHAAQIILARLLVERALAHRVHAQRRVADIHAVVEALGQAFDIGQVFREGFPGPIDAGHHRLGRDVLDRGQAAREPLAVLGLARRQRKAAIAHDHAGHPMPARAAAERVPGDLRVHMGVAVDEAGRDDQPVGIDHPLRRGPDAADLDDPPVLDADIGAIARQSLIRPPRCRF